MKENQRALFLMIVGLGILLTGFAIDSDIRLGLLLLCTVFTLIATILHYRHSDAIHGMALLAFYLWGRLQLHPKSPLMIEFLYVFGLGVFFYGVQYLIAHKRESRARMQ